MIHYEPVKITINAPCLAEVIIDVIVWHHGLLNSIVTNRGLIFPSKFWSSLCYFLSITHLLSTAFHPQTDGQTERQNSIMDAYFWAFVNFKQNDWTKLLPMAKFEYNNAKIASTGHIPFELNCGYHLCISFKKETNLCFWLKTAEKLLAKLQQLMTVCRGEPLLCPRASKTSLQ